MITQKATAAGSGTVAHGKAAPGPERPDRRVTERAARSLPGIPMLALAIVLLLAGVALLVLAAHESGAAKTLLITLGILLLLADAFVLPGLFAVVPGQARVVQLFGQYRGTIRDSGLHWVNPFTRRIAVSTRIRNQESAQAKVNDATETRSRLPPWSSGRSRTPPAPSIPSTTSRSSSRSRPRPPSGTLPPATPTTTGAAALSLRDNADEITERLSAELANRVASAACTSSSRA